MDYKMPRLCFLGKQHGPLLFLFSGYPPICTLDAFYGCLQNVLGKKLINEHTIPQDTIFVLL